MNNQSAIAIPATVPVPAPVSAPAVIPVMATVVAIPISSHALVVAGGLVFTAASFLSARLVLVVICPVRTAWPVRRAMSVRTIEPVVPVRPSVIVSIVLILPAMLVVFVVPAVPWFVMMGLIVMRFFRPLLRRIILLLRLLRGWGIRIPWPGFLAKPVFALGLNRGHPAAAKQAKAA